MGVRYLIAPLRKVVHKFFWPTLSPAGVWYLQLYETLECGHVQKKKTNLLGPYKAESRRCRACAMMKEKKS